MKNRLDLLREAEARATETYPPPSDRARSELGQRAMELRAGYVQGYVDAALDKVPEPVAEEWEYGYAEKLGDTEYVYGDERDVPGWFTTAEEASAARIEDTDYVVGRRKAGPWVPVESEEK